MPTALKPFVAALWFAITGAFVVSLAQAGAGGLIVQNAWARKPPGVDTAAVYFVLENTGARPITVTGASSPVADHVMIHETSTVDGQSRMRMRDRVLIAPGKSVAFAPEGLHVMLSGFSRAIAAGDSLPLTLQLDDGTQLSVAAVVRPLGTN